LDFKPSNTDNISLNKLGEKLYETIDIFEKLTGSNQKPKMDDKKPKNRSRKGK
jgi:hypothetical protein